MIISLALFACGSDTPTHDCADDTTVLVERGEATLTCAEAKRPTRYIRTLAGTPLPAGSTATGVSAVHERFLADPAATQVWLDAIQTAGVELETTAGVAGAKARSHAIWVEHNKQGLLGDDLAAVFQAATKVRATDDETELALTEADIEGWIAYASLCHEVQEAGVLSVSIANRVDIYALTEARFTQGDRAEQVALTSLGVVWESVRERWRAADRDKQQAWVSAAPLPPPMLASSLGYLEAIIEGDVVGHAEVLHNHLGPLHFRDGAGYFHTEP